MKQYNIFAGKNQENDDSSLFLNGKNACLKEYFRQAFFNLAKAFFINSATSRWLPSIIRPH